jgi:hypothetical protein
MSNILFLDIDYTLLIPQNVYVYYTVKGVEKTMDCLTFSSLNLKGEEKMKYDLRDFRDPIPVKNSIVSSIPLEVNLKIIEEYVKEGWILGILTARSCEDIIAETIIEWLKEHLSNFKEIKRENIYAISDEKKLYSGDGSSERKLFVLKDLVEKKHFNKIALIDDNHHTLEIIEDFNKILDKNKRIKLILSKY